MNGDYEVIAGEVRALHGDLAQWLGTTGAAAAGARFIGQQHAEFSMVSLDGVILERAVLAEGLRRAGNSAPGLVIDVVDIEVLHRSPECAVVRFKEIHRAGGAERSRLTTALLVADPAARNGLRWRSVHETAAK
ncbi:hypothetical protein [Nocardia acidivorans]|uniref:hypothetical protein n=1 Tax=Nocardia acidivorans TaxID=404580 RepID=UPI00082C9AFE|nr:hypothetical protein [Nocardia acidivorans]